MFIFATRGYSMCPVLHLRSRQHLGIRVAASVLAVIVLVPRLESQCQPTEFAKTDSGKSANASAETPQFYDQPQFTVAGVADATNLGGHGSDTVVRTKEALAKDTVSLGKPTAHDPSAVSFEAAGKSLREALARDPASFEANRQLGKLLADNGNARDAIPYLEHAAQLRPDRADLHHLLGDVEERAGNPLEAVREYQRAAEMNPSESYLFDWGVELLVHRAADPAIEVFARGNRLFPQSVRMLVALGVSWYSRGSYAQSAACLFEASDLNPGDPTPYLFMGKTLDAEVAQSQGFVDRLGRFAGLQPENALANYYFAVALWKARKDSASTPQVESLLNKAALLDPDLGDAHLLLGVVYSDKGDFPKAIAAYQRAAKADPEREEPHYRLAQVYRWVGEKAKARQELQLYEQLQKQSQRRVERERHEIQQFVFAMRDGDRARPQPPKP